MLIKKPFLLVSLVFTSCAYQAQLEQAHQKANLGQFEGAMLDYQALGAEEYTAVKEKWKQQQYQHLKNAIAENPKQLCEIYEGLKKHREEHFFDHSLSELIPLHIQEYIKLSKQDLIFYAQLLKTTEDLLQASQSESCQKNMFTVVQNLKKRFQPKLEKEWQDKLKKQDLNQLLSGSQILKNTELEDQLPKNWEKSMVELSLKKHIQSVTDLKKQDDQVLGQLWLHYRAIKSLQGYLKQPFIYQSEYEEVEKKLFKPLVVKVEGLINWDMVQKDLNAYQLKDSSFPLETMHQAIYELKINIKPQSCSMRTYSIQKEQKLSQKIQQVDNPHWVSAKAQLQENAKIYKKKIKNLINLEEKIAQLKAAHQESEALEQELSTLTQALIVAEQKESIQREELLKSKSKLADQQAKITQPKTQVFKYPAERWEKYCELPWSLSFKDLNGEEVKINGIEYSVAQDDVHVAYHQQRIPTDQLIFDKSEIELLAENQKNIEQQVSHFLNIRKNELVIDLKNKYLSARNQKSQTKIDNELVSLYLLSDTAMNLTLALQMSKDQALAQDQALIARLHKSDMNASHQMIAKIIKNQNTHQKIANQNEQQSPILQQVSQNKTIEDGSIERLKHKINKSKREDDLVDLNEIVIEVNQ